MDYITKFCCKFKINEYILSYIKKSHAEIIFVVGKVSVAKLVLQVAVTQRIYLLPGNCASIDTLQIRAAFFLLLSH